MITKNPIWMGVTPPFDKSKPTEADEQETQTIINVLKENNNFPSKEENIKRERVLAKINMLIQEFVRQTGRSLGLGEIADELGCKITTSGSYRLDVHGPGADIDTIVIFPSHIKPHHFFDNFSKTLEKRKEVTKCTVVKDAIVPLIKLVFDGIELDLLFAGLSKDTISPDLDILKLDNLVGVSPQTQKAINGPRVAQETLNLVHNKNAFRIALRLIRIWAKKRMIYSNANGYLGGVHTSILVARICQMFPFAAANVIVKRFFQIYGSIWQWPQPVLLKKIEKRSDFSFEVWEKNEKHIMPIITPSYPSMCCTHNVNQSTLRVMNNEFKRGEEILKVGKIHSESSYRELLEDNPFLIEYKSYIKIKIAAKTLIDLNKWHGWIDSRIRFFIKGLEKLGSVLQVHLCPVNFEHPNNKVMNEKEKEEKEKEEKEEKREKEYFYNYLKFVGLKFLNPDSKVVNISQVVQNFHNMVNNWAGINDNMLPVQFKKIRRSEIPDWVLPKQKKKQLIKIRKKENKKRKLIEDKNKIKVESPSKKRLLDNNKVEEIRGDDTSITDQKSEDLKNEENENIETAQDEKGNNQTKIIEDDEDSFFGVQPSYQRPMQTTQKGGFSLKFSK